LPVVASPEQALVASVGYLVVHLGGGCQEPSGVAAAQGGLAVWSIAATGELREEGGRSFAPAGTVAAAGG
jgi:hypothetical protein